jgi:hypothetical protein
MNTASLPPAGRSRATSRQLVVALLGLLALVATPAADDNLCFRSTGEPFIDGVTNLDDGWRRATQYVFGNGSTDPHAIVQFTRTSSAAFISFDVRNDTTFDDLDVIVVTLSPGGGAANDRRIHIFPIAADAGNATSTPGGLPREVKYWIDSTDWNATGADPLPAWLSDAAENIKVTSSAVPAPGGFGSYIVEMKIPISAVPNDGVNLPASGTFGLYFNIVRVTDEGNAALGELHWPSTAPNVGGTLPLPIAVETNTPAPSAWGSGLLANTCAGVRVTNVFTNHPTDTYAIDPNSTNNRFSVTLSNDGTAAASGITATVKSSKFGISGSPGPIGPIGAPLPPIGPTGTLAPGGTATIQSQAWDVLNDPNRATYLTWPNVCSFVELNGAAGQIANRYYPWNLHLGTASRFRHSAVLDARGLPAQAGERRQRFDLHVSDRHEIFVPDDYQRAARLFGDDLRREPSDNVVREMRANAKENSKLETLRLIARFAPGQIDELRQQRPLSTLTRVVHGYLLTGRYIEINGKRFRLKDPVNSYTYIITHKGRAVGWKNSLTGPNVKGERGRFVAEVPVNTEIALTTTAETQTRPGGQGGICATFRRSTGLGLVGALGLAGLIVRRRARRDD